MSSQSIESLPSTPPSPRELDREEVTPSVYGRIGTSVVEVVKSRLPFQKALPHEIGLQPLRKGPKNFSAFKQPSSLGEDDYDLCSDLADDDYDLYSELADEEFDLCEELTPQNSAAMASPHDTEEHKAEAITTRTSPPTPPSDREVYLEHDYDSDDSYTKGCTNRKAIRCLSDSILEDLPSREALRATTTPEEISKNSLEDAIPAIQEEQTLEAQRSHSLETILDQGPRIEELTQGEPVVKTFNPPAGSDALPECRVYQLIPFSSTNVAALFLDLEGRAKKTQSVISISPPQHHGRTVKATYVTKVSRIMPNDISEFEMKAEKNLNNSYSFTWTIEDSTYVKKSEGDFLVIPYEGQTLIRYRTLTTLKLPSLNYLATRDLEGSTLSIVRKTVSFIKETIELNSPKLKENIHRLNQLVTS